MAWNDGHSTEWNQMTTRRIRPPYVPPHLRPNGFSDHNTTTSYAFTQYGFRPNLSGRGGFTRGRGGGGGRGRGRGQWGGRQREAVAVATDPTRRPIEDLSDVSEKFDELEVIEETVTTEGSGINFDAYEDIPVEVSGEDIPPPVNTFADIELGEALDRNIRRCKYVKPTPVQRHAIPVALAGRDLMACAQTGSGKTAAFCFPIISRILKNRDSQPPAPRGGSIAYPGALILSPTRELTCQIHDEAKKFALQTGIKVVVAYGGAPISQQLRNLEKGVDILVATPGRLVDMIERERVSLTMIRYLALDEADRMLDMGFEPQIRKIVQQMDMPPPGQRQTLLFSATFPEEIQKLASDFLSNYVFLAVGRVGSSTELIAQRVDFVQDLDKRGRLLDILNSQRANGSHGKHALTLVFVETKKGADALEQWLFSRGFPATAIHGDKVQMERERALRSFKSGNTPIMVATDVAARGLDVPHVAHVINFDLPKDIDDYVHRIGRTGRAGNSGVATAFFNDKNLPLAKALVELMREANQEIPPWLSEHAETSFAGGGRSGHHRGSSKFGGYDYRSGSQFGSENNCQSRLSADAGSYHGSNSAGNYYGDPDYNTEPSGYQYSSGPAGYYGDSTVTDYNAPPSSYPYASAGSQGYVFGHESVVASGWE